MIAFVRSLIFALIVSAVTFRVFGSTSAKTGITPRYISGVSAPISVIEVVMISSPGFGLTVATAMWIAAEPRCAGVGVFHAEFLGKFLFEQLAELSFCRGQRARSQSFGHVRDFFLAERPSGRVLIGR